MALTGSVKEFRFLRNCGIPADALDVDIYKAFANIYEFVDNDGHDFVYYATS